MIPEPGAGNRSMHVLPEALGLTFSKKDVYCTVHKNKSFEFNVLPVKANQSVWYLYHIKNSFKVLFIILKLEQTMNHTNKNFHHSEGVDLKFEFISCMCKGMSKVSKIYKIA